MPSPDLRQRLKDLLADRTAWYRRRRVLIPVACLAGYALIGFLLVPAGLRHYLPRIVQDTLGAEASVAELNINPFLFTVEMRGFAMKEANGVPLFGFERLFVDFELSSLFRWAWTFADIRLEQPELELVMESDGRLNLQRVLDAMPPSPEPAPAPDAQPPRVLLQLTELLGGRVRYADLRGTQPVRTEIGPVDLRFDSIATLHEQRGPSRLSAALPGGATLAWEGEVGLHPLASRGSLRLKGFEPRAVWDFMREKVSLAPPGGVIDASLSYEFSNAGNDVVFRADPIAFTLRDLALQRADAAAPMLELQAIEMNAARFDLAARHFEVGSLSVRGGHAVAAIDAAGVLDWSTLVLAPPAAASPPVAAPAGAAQAPWRVDLGAFLLEDVAVEASDANRAAVLGIALAARRMGFGASVLVGDGEPEVKISGAAVELGEIALTTGPERAPLGRIARLWVEDAAADLTVQSIQLKRIGIEGLDTSIQRLADGSIREIALASTPDPAVPLPVTAAATQWSVKLGELAVSGIDAGFSDASTTPPLAVAVKGGTLAVRDLDTAGAAPFGLEAKLPLAQGGEIALGGTATVDARTAELQLKLAAVALAPLAPLVSQQTTLTLDSGALSAEAAITYAQAEDGSPVVQAKGTFGIEDLLLKEAATGERFLSWRSLAATGVEFGLGPDRLAVRELRLAEPGAKIVVFKDRTTNLAQVMRQPAAPAPEAPVPAAVADAAPFPVMVERVRVDGATVDFTDLSLVLPFAARIERLKGVASGISSASSSRATLAFNGRVGEFGEAEIEGMLAPFDPTRFTDVEVSFRNIALSPFSPYSATFAGRTIASGDLSLGLEYKMTDGELAGENQLVLQDFTLGDAVESPDAVSLPLDLAIALLTDSDGRIDLTVPVSGNIGDPQFSYGHVIWQALGNVIRGVVTAPFRALGSLFGGEEAEAMQAVRFKSGSAELMPRELERIAKVAEALASRPQLAVSLPPGVDAERDGYAVRRLAVRRAHAEQLELELEPGEDPGPVSYDNPRSQRALEKLLELREGEAAPDAFVANWAKAEGREPERVNAALALLGRGGGDAGYYRALYLHLVNSTPEPASELAALGRARAEAIVAEFGARGLEPARVGIGEPAALAQARPTGVLLPLELVASPK